MLHFRFKTREKSPRLFSINEGAQRIIVDRKAILINVVINVLMRKSERKKSRSTTSEKKKVDKTVTTRCGVQTSV